MYNEYPLGLKSCIREVSTGFKSKNPEFSQRLDEIATDETEEVGISATLGIYMLMSCIIVLTIFIYNINIFSGILVIIILLPL